MNPHQFIIIKGACNLDLFPYPHFRISKEHLIESIEQAIRTRKNVFLVTPSGTSKTIMTVL